MGVDGVISSLRETTRRHGQRHLYLTGAERQTSRWMVAPCRMFPRPAANQPKETYFLDATILDWPPRTKTEGRNPQSSEGRRVGGSEGRSGWSWAIRQHVRYRYESTRMVIYCSVNRTGRQNLQGAYEAKCDGFRTISGAAFVAPSVTTRISWPHHMFDRPLLHDWHVEVGKERIGMLLHLNNRRVRETSWC